MHPKCGNLCGQRGRKRFIVSWGLRIFANAPHAPPPKGLGQRSKVVILPTAAARNLSYITINTNTIINTYNTSTNNTSTTSIYNTSTTSTSPASVVLYKSHQARTLGDILQREKNQPQVMKRI
jgi:hypothetical protein